MTLPTDLRLYEPEPVDLAAIAALVAACDETYRAWTPSGWQPPPRGRELDRWRGRIADGSWWTRIAVEPGGRVVGLVCFTQALATLEPIPERAHVSAVFTHPDRWRQGIATAMLDAAEAAMRSEGYREVELWTPQDAPARSFYEAAGWRHDGRIQWLAELALPIVGYVKAL